MVGDQVLDSSNPVYRDFACNLFDTRVASLTISKDVTVEEICKFFEILRYTPEDIADRGGLRRVLTLSDIRGLQAQGIDFSAFHTTEVDKVHTPKTTLVEEETTVLWKAFVSGMVSGTLDPNGEKLAPDADLDPELLAEIMNREDSVESKNLVRNYEEAVTSFLKETDRSQLKSQACQETLGRLGDLVGNLKPELRRSFLNSTLNSCSGHDEAAAELLGHLPQAQILEAMEQVDADKLEVPRTLMDVLGKLSQQRDPHSTGSRVAGQRARSSEETADLLGQLFSADKADQFVPEDYQEALAVLAAAETLPGLDRKQVDELLETMEGHAVEKHFCNIMIDLLDQGTQVVTEQAICRNMEELIFYFLETGDFTSLTSVHNHLSRHLQKNKDGSTETGEKALQIFSSEEFVDHVIDGFETWGKPKYASIKGLIKRVKGPFIPPLLDLLAKEQSMTKRRLFIECLQETGNDARAEIEARLHDKRWFVVRNLVILLRATGDPDVLKPLGRLVGYANAKVQFEVMRTFLHFRDSRAERYLLKELDSNEPQVLLNVARLAANSHNPEVAQKLSTVLNRRLPKERDENIKSVVIKALAEMGCPEALPELEKFLHSRNLFQSLQGNTIKVEAVKTLTRYDDPAAAALAVDVYRKYSGELARTAGNVCLKLNGKLPWT
jgi:hypothetical protein